MKLSYHHQSNVGMAYWQAPKSFLQQKEHQQATPVGDHFQVWFRITPWYTRCSFNQELNITQNTQPSSRIGERREFISSRVIYEVKRSRHEVTESHKTDAENAHQKIHFIRYRKYLVALNDKSPCALKITTGQELISSEMQARIDEEHVLRRSC